MRTPIIAIFLVLSVTVTLAGCGNSAATPTPPRPRATAGTARPASTPTPTPSPIKLEKALAVPANGSNKFEFHLVAGNRATGSIKNTGAMDILITGPKEEVLLSERAAVEKSIDFPSVGEGNYRIAITNLSAAALEAKIELTLFWR